MHCRFDYFERVGLAGGTRPLLQPLSIQKPPLDAFSMKAVLARQTAQLAARFILDEAHGALVAAACFVGTVLGPVEFRQSLDDLHSARLVLNHGSVTTLSCCREGEVKASSKRYDESDHAGGSERRLSRPVCK